MITCTGFRMITCTMKYKRYYKNINNNIQLEHNTENGKSIKYNLTTGQACIGTSPIINTVHLIILH